MKAATATGGNTIFIPPGNYLIQETLDVPENVVLEGVFRAPTARPQNRGSTLLAVAGAGKADGQPFLTLHQNSTLHGLTVFYPEQKQSNPPVPYPWTVRGIGDNCSLVDVLLVNPYQAVDFGTRPAGRHLIKGLYAQPLFRGLFIDQCFDVGRIEDVHLWPFWGGWEGGLGKFTREQGIAFVIGRTDWEYLSVGDIVVAIRASVGKALLVPAHLDGANLTQGTAKISPGPLTHRRYLFYVVNSTPSQQRFSALAKGATFREITLDMLRRFDVPLPLFSEQESIASFLDRETAKMDVLMAKVRTAIERLTEYRTALISAAVTGQIDVRSCR